MPLHIMQEYYDDFVNIEVFDKVHLFISGNGRTIKVCYNQETFNKLKEFINAV